MVWLVAMEIRYFNRVSGRVETERVYGDGAVRWLYGTRTGGVMASWVARSHFLSALYGMIQSSFWSRGKIAPFVEKFGIDLDEFEWGDGGTANRPYRSFNDFFIRKFKSGKRTFSVVSGELPAFCEGRYYGYEKVDERTEIPVKGKFLQPEKLLGDRKWGGVFRGGPLLLARLCPVDYHRFHFPDRGRVLEHYRLPGLLHSVNPLALTKKGNIFFTNKREVSILDTEHFGKLAYIEVGAVCVGKIVQTSAMKDFSKGQEKGYFLFGGSSVILMGTPGSWTPSTDILRNTCEGMETYVRLGEPLGGVFSG